jgi:O-acetyl-ADP-ribose deacetylase (regulator of RNase III)
MVEQTDKYSVSINSGTLKLLNSDICDEQVDAIVNAANEELSHGGGVAGAISRRGGSVVNKESRIWIQQHGRVKTGTAAFTRGGNLAAKYVIHAVGPIYHNGKEGAKAQLISCVRNSLILGEKLGVKSISFPAISSGIFGYPKEESADVIMKCVARYLFEDREEKIEEVRITIIDKLTYDIFKAKFKQLFIKQQVSLSHYLEFDDKSAHGDKDKAIREDSDSEDSDKQSEKPLNDQVDKKKRSGSSMCCGCIIL